MGIELIDVPSASTWPSSTASQWPPSVLIMCTYPFVREEAFLLGEEQGSEADPDHIRDPQRLGVCLFAGARADQQGCDDAGNACPGAHVFLRWATVVPDHVGRWQRDVERAEAWPDVDAVLRGLVDLIWIVRRAEVLSVSFLVVESDASEDLGEGRRIFEPAPYTASHDLVRCVRMGLDVRDSFRPGTSQGREFRTALVQNDGFGDQAVNQQTRGLGRIGEDMPVLGLLA
jgi:hypothetical protein